MAAVVIRARIALDFDSTLANTMHFVLPYINGIKGTAYTSDQILHWTFLIDQGHGKEFWGAYDLMDKSGARISLPPLDPHVADVLTELVRRYDIEIVTSNHGVAAAGISDWLRRWAPHVADLIPVNAIGRVSASEKASLGYDIFIDDAPSLAAAVRDNPKKGLLLANWRWNEFYDSERTQPIEDQPHLRRFRTWEEVPALIASVEQILADRQVAA